MEGIQKSVLFISKYTADNNSGSEVAGAKIMLSRSWLKLL